MYYLAEQHKEQSANSVEGLMSSANNALKHNILCRKLRHMLRLPGGHFRLNTLAQGTP